MLSYADTVLFNAELLDGGQQYRVCMTSSISISQFTPSSRSKAQCVAVISNTHCIAMNKYIQIKNDILIVSFSFNEQCNLKLIREMKLTRKAIHTYMHKVGCQRFGQLFTVPRKPNTYLHSVSRDLCDSKPDDSFHGKEFLMSFQNDRNEVFKGMQSAVCVSQAESIENRDQHKIAGILPMIVLNDGIDEERLPKRTSI